MWRYVLLFLFFTGIKACAVRKAEFGKICVCNSTYCDTIQVGKVSPGTVKIFLTSNETPGFNSREVKFSSSKQSGITLIKVNDNVKFQKILGFGGAFTDSTGHNIKLLPEAAQKKLIESYFSDDGIEYSMQRVPLGGADFSPSFYTLDEHPNDMELKYFALHEEDLNHKIPFMKQAFSLRKQKPLRLFTSAWTIPSWMRYSPGYTVVKKSHYQVYAEYYRKYFDEYAKHGIKFWGMTTQNEAPSGLLAHGIAGVFWIPHELNKWIRDHLGPTLKNSSHDIKILLHDDNWGGFPFVVTPVVKDQKTATYIDGVALHWYSFGRSPFEVLNLAKIPNKEVILMNSEACYFITRPYLGDWSRATRYADLVMNHLANGFHSWIDWNLAVNASGGPNNMNLNADAPIVISADGKEFYKQPFFYVFGHFTKFLPPDSVRVDLSFEHTNLDVRAVAFLRPDNLTAVVVHNRNEKNATKVQLTDNKRYSEIIDIPAASVQTFIY